MYYRVFYFGDRISGTASVTIDGEAYELKTDDISAIHGSSKEIKARFRSEANAAAISIHGGEYGPYTLIVHIDGIDLPLEAVIYQYNWYNVSRFDLHITIDREAETITLSSTANVLSENGEWSTEDHTTTAGFSDGKYEHYIIAV